MAWEHRVVRHDPRGESYLGIHEVYDGDSPTEDPVPAAEDTLDDLRTTLCLMLIATHKPVIECPTCAEGSPAHVIERCSTGQDEWETPCPGRDDKIHCDHWYDGESCCGCGDDEGRVDGEDFAVEIVREGIEKTVQSPESDERHLPDPNAAGKCESCGASVPPKWITPGSGHMVPIRGRTRPEHCGPMTYTTPDGTRWEHLGGQWEVEEEDDNG